MIPKWVFELRAKYLSDGSCMSAESEEQPHRNHEEHLEQHPELRLASPGYAERSSVEAARPKGKSIDSATQ
jgi:hypothetical protein